MPNQLSPDKDHGPFKWSPGRLWRSEVTEVDQLAEEDYFHRYGKRKVSVHLIKRSSDSKDRFVIQDKFLPFLNRFPKNIAIFYDVDLVDKTAESAGWLYLEEIRDNMVLEDDGWRTIHRHVLRPGSSIPAGM